MEESKIKVYVKIDENNCIIDINSSIFIDNIDNYIQIDEGLGDKYAHAQGNYLDKPLMDNQGRCNYKLVNNELIELVENEKGKLFPPIPVEPSKEEILQKQLLETQNMILELQYKLTNKDLEKSL
ncbi:hypothetical protein [Clostridium taeniosporum]|uniref:Uncharacterized protein n=1 Tax=Clostridium taeniosporum TaxID=394958 RepID=A0A1D7XLR5_9CLOT|nr:hypothetical protein [Clostridium taeniosporum]AOR24295.1 hypothetical protein BGI42_11355 [Clostridium taeniosporum]